MNVTLRCGIACLATVAMGVAQTPVTPVGPVMQEMPGFAPQFWPVVNAPYFGPCDIARHVRCVDVDNDQDLDVVVAPLPMRQGRLLLNDGHGRLTDVSTTHLPSAGGQCWQIASGDIDGDGDVDLVFPLTGHGRFQQFLVFVNDGTGRFTDESLQRIPSVQAFPYTYNDCAVLGDFDGDGDLDLVRSGGTSSVQYPDSARLLSNDGNGVFTDTPGAFPMDGGIRSGLRGTWQAEDVDRDGDPDLVGTVLAGGIAYWINDGTGRFTDGAVTRVHPPPFQYVFLDVRLGDVDGDGDPDLVGSRGYMRDYPLLFLNDGTGHLHEVTATHIPVPSEGGLALRFGDFDEDGDLDFVSTVSYQPGTSYLGDEMLFVNDGSGHFEVDREEMIFPDTPNGAAFDCAVADLDGDGDLDAILPDGGGGTAPICRMRYYSNTLRHVHATDRPTRGAPWRVTVHGPPRGFGFVALSPRTATTPLPPFGAFHLDPATTVVWPTTVYFETRRADLVIPIPPLPALGGQPIYTQALVVDPQNRARFTNLWIEDAIR